MAIVDIPHPAAAEPGVPEPANAASVVEALARAAQACLDGDCDGIVTGPVHKAAINEGGIAFTGTTGLLAAHAGCEVVMMLANDIVRVALLTVHMPLRAVADAITAPLPYTRATSPPIRFGSVRYPLEAAIPSRSSERAITSVPRTSSM